MARRIGGWGNSRGFEVDSQYGSMIILSIVLVIIFSLGIGTEVPPAQSYMQGTSSDIFPTLTDLNPSMPKAVYDSIPAGNYQFIFQDLSFSFANAGALMAGICANFIFAGAVTLGKSTSFILNLTMSSDYIPSRLGNMIEGLTYNSMMKGFVTYIIPITYGVWAMWVGFTQKKYTTALLGLLGVVMLYATASWIVDKPAEIMKSVSRASSQIGMAVASSGTSTDSDGNVPTERVMADNLWIAQIYMPWSIIQFKDPGFQDFENRYDSKGNLKLYIAPLAGKEAELTDNWANTLLKQNGPLTADESDKVQKAIYDTEESTRHFANPVDSFTAALIILAVNLTNAIIIIACCILAIIADFGLFTLLIFTAPIFILSTIPALGRKVYRIYVSLAISAFVIKAVLMLIVGTQIRVLSMTFLNTISDTSNVNAALGLGAFLSIFPTSSAIALVWIIIRYSNRGHAPSILANAALGRFDKVGSELQEWRAEGGIGIKDFVASRINNPALAKNLLGADMEKIIQRQLTKGENLSNEAEALLRSDDPAKIQKGLELQEKAKHVITSAGNKANDIRQKAADQFTSVKYQHLTRRSMDLLSDMQRDKLELLTDAYRTNMNKTIDPQKRADIETRYLEDIAEVAEESKAIMLSPNSDVKTIRMASDVYNRTLEIKNDLELDKIKNLNKRLGDRQLLENQLSHQVAAGEITSAQMQQQLKDKFGDVSNEKLIGDINRFIQNAQNDLQDSRDEKTTKVLEGYIQQAVGMKQDMFDNDLNKIADSDKLAFLEKALREDDRIKSDPAMYQYVQSKIAKSGMDLMKKHAESLAPQERFSYWKQQLDAELSKPVSTRNNANIDFLRNNVQTEYMNKIESEYKGFVSFAQTEQSAAVKRQLDDLINNIGATGDVRARAEAMQDMIKAREAIFNNAQNDIESQLSVLRELQASTKYEDVKDLLDERVNELVANKFNRDVRSIASMIQAAQNDRSEAALAAIADAVAKMEVPYTDMTPLANKIIEGQIQDVQDFANALESHIVEARKVVPAWDKLNDILNRQESITHEAVAALKYRIEGRPGFATSNHEIESYLKQWENSTDGELKSMITLIENSLHGNRSGEVSRTVQGFKEMLAHAITGTEGEMREELAKRLKVMQEISDKVYQIARESEEVEFLNDSRDKEEEGHLF